jgi:hypothetical protein
MDALDDLCGSSDASSEDEATDQPPMKRSAAAKPKLEDLERAGYQAGPSVLHVPEQRAAEPEGTWEWSKGAADPSADTEPTDEVSPMSADVIKAGIVLH